MPTVTTIDCQTSTVCTKKEPDKLDEKNITLTISKPSQLFVELATASRWPTQI